MFAVDDDADAADDDASIVIVTRSIVSTYSTRFVGLATGVTVTRYTVMVNRGTVEAPDPLDSWQDSFGQVGRSSGTVYIVLCYGGY